ncbi:hypothetical protein P3X46_028728 [Hevea brasiliensis]|uniref:VQ domain-containing protein n=1 Tax=Hevea brasiliensis TaxID=3981 RepID=A0ABQ9KRU0_HEVBR|nr:VQ motif-containing protein 9 [Hevea brasiliensis]XP_057994673.1 VQ motif-containing protein 9 [Hevea brasiliensis]KAJ9146464.1 hypothetical protein P3X46_028728 [Hevea brasiliensis]
MIQIFDHYLRSIDTERNREIFVSIMDKSCQSSGDSIITAATSSARDQYLKNLNKLSHKISKPIITKKPPPPFDHHTFNNNNINSNTSSQSQTQSQASQQQNLQAQQQHQPPVYNINKNDFRDVVQKLTGSPAHERFSTPPPIHPPKPPSTRLQRIRPPPLAHVSNRPPPLINSAIPPSHQPPPPPLNASVNPPMPTATSTNNFIQRPSAPLSPLPPFPGVHAAAESPVSAYMRLLQNSISGVDSNNQFLGFSPLAPLVSPRWNNLPPQRPQLHQNQQQFTPLQQGILPSLTSGMLASQPQFQLPSSPPPFGCLNSPRSPHPLFSPGLLLSPSSFPVSPTLPVPSPRWRAL